MEDAMDMEQWMKLAPTLSSFALGAIALWLGIRQFILTRKNNYREEYKFVKSFFDDITANPKMHQFAKHKGYQAVIGRQDMSSEAIEYLMSIPGSAGRIDDYVRSRSYLKHTISDGIINFEFAGAVLFATASRRKFWKIFYFILFCLSYSFAFFPMILASFLRLNLRDTISILAVTVPVGIMFAVNFLNESMQLGAAIRLFDNVQEQNSARIFKSENYDERD